MTDAKHEARSAVLQLEALCGERLDEVPVDRRDQWMSAVRDLFLDLDVDLDNLEQANAAFAGARLTSATMMTNSPKAGLATAHLMRYLLDKSEGYKGDRSKRRRFRVWLARKALPQ